jgi:hypothetical protein
MIGYNPAPLGDIDGHWGRDAIEQASARGLVAGYGDRTYRPDRDITRAEFTQLIYNALDPPQNRSAGIVYRDVSFGEWFYNAVSASKQAGFLNGLAADSGDFNPNQPMTRREMAMALANVATERQATVIGDMKAEQFKDFGQIGDDYAEAVETAINAGFLDAEGMGGGYFLPNGFVTRAQAATIQTTLLRILSGIN